MSDVLKKANPIFTFFVEHSIEAENEDEARKELQDHLDNGNLSLDNQGEWLCRVDEPAPRYEEGLHVRAENNGHEFQGQIESYKGFEDGSHVYTVVDQEDNAWDLDEDSIIEVM